MENGRYEQHKVPTNRDWARVLAEAWLDDDFKRLLETDPLSAFRQAGIQVDAVFQVPGRPQGIDDEELQPLAAGDAQARLTTADLASAAVLFCTMFDAGR